MSKLLKSMKLDLTISVGHIAQIIVLVVLGTAAWVRTEYRIKSLEESKVEMKTAIIEVKMTLDRFNTIMASYERDGKHNSRN